MTTPNTAWALTYLHKTSAHLPQLAHFPMHIKNIYRIHKKPKIPKGNYILLYSNFYKIKSQRFLLWDFFCYLCNSDGSRFIS